MSNDMLKDKKESFLEFANRIVTDKNIKEYGILHIFKSLFENDNVSYDNAQRQLLGIRKFLNEYRKDLIDKEMEQLDENLDSVKDVVQQLDISINADGSQTSNALLQLSEEQIKTPKLLLEAHGYDNDMWELVNSKNSMWHQNSNKYGLKTLYCSKITVKPRTEISIEKVQEIFEKMDREYTNPVANTYFSFSDKNECLVLNFFDVHFSKLAHSSESGENYDYKIAKKRIMDSVYEYKHRFMGRHFDNIYFAIGQDYFNSEPTGNTVGNTKQDNDSRYSVMFEEGVKTLVDVIEILRDMGTNIIVPLIQGNHSTYTEYYAAQYLKAWYRRDVNITICASPMPRKYYTFGTNLFGFTHNSEEKNRIYTLMQIEAAEEWGKTVEHTWFTGHLHCEDVKENGGVYIRQAPTLCGTDAWHKRSGYVNPIKRTQAFVYDYDKGLVESHYVRVMD